MGSRPTVDDETEAAINQILCELYGYPERTTSQNSDSGQKIEWLLQELRDEHAEELGDVEEYYPPDDLR